MSSRLRATLVFAAACWMALITPALLNAQGPFVISGVVTDSAKKNLTGIRVVVVVDGTVQSDTATNDGRYSISLNVPRSGASVKVYFRNGTSPGPQYRQGVAHFLTGTQNKLDVVMLTTTEAVDALSVAIDQAITEGFKRLGPLSLRP
jgi:hypothetical protein